MTSSEEYPHDCIHRDSESSFGGARTGLAYRPIWCGECGGLKAGVPGLFQTIYRWRYEKWFHQ